MTGGPAASGLVGVYGGTFDPVHFGHLRTALELREAAGLDAVRFVLAARPPHRDAPRAPAALRRRMLAAALQGEPAFVLDDLELRRDGPSYTVDTLESLRASMPGATLCLLLGMDAFLGLPGWHRWQRILELANLCVAHRPGWTPPPAGELAALLGERRVSGAGELAGRHGRVWLHEVTALDISSSDIRARLGRGADVRYLVPEAVRRIIIDTGCYRGTPEAA